MNWGLKIAILYGGFVLLILTLVFAASKQEFHLVTPDYYGEEFNHPARMQRMENSRNLEQGLLVSYVAREKQVVLQFPSDKNGVSGEVLLYRPSNSHLDQLFPVKADEANRMVIPAGELSRGLWRVQVEWQSGGTGYYDEKAIVVE